MPEKVEGDEDTSKLEKVEDSRTRKSLVSFNSAVFREEMTAFRD